MALRLVVRDLIRLGELWDKFASTTDVYGNPVKGAYRQIASTLAAGGNLSPSYFEQVRAAAIGDIRVISGILDEGGAYLTRLQAAADDGAGFSPSIANLPTKLGALRAGAQNVVAKIATMMTAKFSASYSNGSGITFAPLTSADYADVKTALDTLIAAVESVVQ